jgi:hypothetical protein
MARQAHARWVRLIAVFVLVAFTGSLFAPALQAEQAAAAQAAAARIPTDTGVMTGNAKVALSDLWYSWVRQGGSSSVKPDRLFAQNFFRTKGATPHQADILVNNAQLEGRLSTPMPTSQSGIGGFFRRILGIGGAQQPAAATAGSAASASGRSGASGLMGRVRSLVGGIGGGSSSGSGAPVPNGLLGGASGAASRAGSVAVVSASGVRSVHGGPPQVPPPSGPRPGWGDKVHEGINRAGDVVQGAHRKVQGVGYDMTSALSTALFTAKDKFDIRQFYSIPITDTAAVKITGGSQYNLKFTNKGWVNQEMTAKVGLIDAIRSNEALGQVGQLQTQVGPAQVTSGGLGKIVSRFSDTLTRFRNKITGKPSLAPGEVQELGKLKIEANLLEHAQGVTQAQNAIKVRIDKLTGDAQRLGRPVPAEEIGHLSRTFDTLEVQKKDLVKKINQVDGSSPGSVVNNGMKWALYSVGIQAGVNVIRQVVSGEKVDFKSALSFVGQPSFWGGTVGGFIGSMVVSHLASSLIPGGGIFMRVLPGFLGAAFGYEAGASLFGGGSGDWIGTIGATLASAGGYALAYSLLGGAMAPGIALIGAGIAAGALFNFIYAKLRGAQGGGGANNPPIPPPDLGVPPVDPQVNISSVPGTDAGVRPQASPLGSGNLESAMRTMQQAYTEYINFLKDGKVTDARTAFDRYIKAKGDLDATRQSAVASAAAAAGR